MRQLQHEVKRNLELDRISESVISVLGEISDSGLKGFECFTFAATYVSRELAGAFAARAANAVIVGMNRSFDDRDAEPVGTIGGGLVSHVGHLLALG